MGVEPVQHPLRVNSAKSNGQDIGELSEELCAPPLGSSLIEFAALGLFAGRLATVAAEVSVYILQVRVMEMGYSPTPGVWVLGVISGMVLVAALGVYSCRSVVSSPPLALLREL